MSYVFLGFKGFFKKAFSMSDKSLSLDYSCRGGNAHPTNLMDV